MTELNIIHQGLPYPKNIHFIYDLNTGTFIFLAEWISQLFELEPEETSSDTILSKLPQDDLLILGHAYNEIKNGEFSGSLKIRIVKQEQDEWLSITPFLTETASQKLIFGSVSNVTAEVHNFDSISKYANKKNAVLYMLSHDLRGPLNIAKSLIDTLSGQDLDDPVLKKTRFISTVLGQSLSLITDLVNREFLETTEVELVKKRIDIAKKMKEYTDEWQRSFGTEQRTLQFSSTSSAIFLSLDEAKFMQTVNNLISNALKFTKSGGTITIHIRELEQSVLFSFSDDGIGIPKEYLSKVFDKFTKARRNGLNGEPTIGLGLSIVKTIVEWHQGKIWCESEENNGSTFFIEIPNDPE